MTTTVPRILIVDDEPNIRLMIAAALETSGGFDVVEATNGQEALARFERDDDRPDLIILDLSMPLMGGMQFLEALQRLEPTSRPKVIVLTAHASIASAVRAVRLGASDFLQKPVAPDDLRLSVAAVLEEPTIEPAWADAVATALAEEPYSEVLETIRRDLFTHELDHAEELLYAIAARAANDPEYLNLLGVLHEAEGNRRAARTFYRKANAIPGRGYAPARQNLRRLYELETFGESRVEVSLGDESKLLRGLNGALGASHLDRLRRILE